MPVGEKRVKELRERLGLSQERFARLLGVSLQTVRRWEGGVSRPLPFLTIRLEELGREMKRREEGGGAMAERRRRPEKGLQVEVGLGGLGGLFKGLGGLLDLVSKMVEEGKEEETRTGVKEVLGGKGRMVYGFSVRVGMGGQPVIQSFGNVRETEAGPQVAEVREPLVDVLDEGDEVRVVAEMPGVEEKDIRVEVKEDVLTLSAESGDRRYYKEVLLPSPVKGQVRERSYNNGVLEVRFTKQT